MNDPSDTKPKQNPTMNFNLPEFTQFYKFLLVDEIVSCSNPALIHFGKCSVIGYLIGADRIGSLTIPNLPACYQVPDCSLSLPLVINFHPHEFLNSTVEIFGEVRLFDATKSSKPDEHHLESAHSLIQKLRLLQEFLEEKRGLPPRPPSGTNDKSMHPVVKGKLQKEIEEMKKKFKPVIQVHTMRKIAEAREIIAENLRFRQILNMRASHVKR